MKNIKEKINNYKLTNTKKIILLNLIFSIIEIITGILTNSIAIISNAINDLSDFFTISITSIFNKKSKKTTNKKYSFGYSRITLVGKFITSIILLISSIIIIYFAIIRIINPKEINYDAMIIFAIFGILINSYAAIKLKNDENKNNYNLVQDIIRSIILLLGSILIKIFNYPIIDPILSILFAMFIILQIYKIFKEIYYALMESVPNNISIDKIKTNLLKYDNIDKINDIHIWSIDNNIFITMHIILRKIINDKEIIKLKNNIKEELHNLNINNITLEIEYPNESI